MALFSDEKPDMARFQTPFIQLDLGDLASKKRKRRTLNRMCTEKKDAAETQCCLWEYDIDFEKEGWEEWIIWPSRYKVRWGIQLDYEAVALL